jgi:hypothetical protein
MTECNFSKLKFQAHNKREVVADFDGGDITSDAGVLLLKQTDQKISLLQRFANCFVDARDARFIEHSILDLASQRVYGLCLGYEDVNDHDDIRRDRLLTLVVGKNDVEGKHRRRESDKGIALAGKSTLNRLEQVPFVGEMNRYHKIGYSAEKVDRLMTDIFLESFKKAPKRIFLDLDTTDAILHGEQEGRFFHGYYDNYCYTPLYIFCGEHLLLSRLQSANVDAAAHAVVEIKRIVAQIRETWSEVEIVLRGDSGFCRDELMSFCEENNICYVFGLAQNARLLTRMAKKMKKSRRRYFGNRKSTRRYADFNYRTQKSWSKSRRVVGKAEYLDKGANPRFIVTNLDKDIFKTQMIYEEIYCARGDMENRIKEQQMDLYADRVSNMQMKSNQLRLYFSGIAYILMQAFRRIGLTGTEYAKAQCGTIRTRLMKLGALIKISVRRIVISLANACPYADVLRQAWQNLTNPPIAT